MCVTPEQLPTVESLVMAPVSSGAILRFPTMPVDGIPLHKLALFGLKDAIENYPDLALHIHNKDSHGRTPLMFACSTGQVEAVNALIHAGADINGEDDNGWTPLMYACAGIPSSGP